MQKPSTIAPLLLASLVCAALPAAAASYQYRQVIPGLVASPTPQAPEPVAELLVALSSGSLPAATVRQFYQQDLKALLTLSGEEGADKNAATWSVVGGSLPTDLALSADGVISGTPSVKNEAGASFQVEASYKGKSGQQSYTIVVNGVVLNVAQISVGIDHACVVTTAGGVKCWGANASGQLGNNTKVASLAPVDVQGLASGVASIAAGASFTCAVTTDGAAKCWGSNGSGQLGDSSYTQRLTPVAVSGAQSGVQSVVAGDSHTCLRTTGGALKCWGANTYGQVGDASTSTRTAPVSVSGMTSGVTALSAGGNVTCAVQSGVAKCWGQNNYGQLGNGISSTGTASTPSSVADNYYKPVVSITTGGNHSCAVLNDATLRCWGSNTYGQLGRGFTGMEQPLAGNVQGVSGVAQVYVGANHTCYLSTGGGVKCVGRNNAGEVGTGTTSAYYATVQQVSGLTSGVSALSLKAGFTCALVGTEARCWGQNGYGQLGDGTKTARNVPTPVVP